MALDDPKGKVFYLVGVPKLSSLEKLIIQIFQVISRAYLNSIDQPWSIGMYRNKIRTRTSCFCIFFPLNVVLRKHEQPFLCS